MGAAPQQQYQMFNPTPQTAAPQYQAYAPQAQPTAPQNWAPQNYAQPVQQAYPTQVQNNVAYPQGFDPFQSVDNSNIPF